MKHVFFALLVMLGFAGKAMALDCNDSILQFPMSEITRVVQAKPEAADTVEGIHLLWIRWQEYQESIDVTKAALACLESQGVMEQVHFGNRVLWRRAR